MTEPCKGIHLPNRCQTITANCIYYISTLPNRCKCTKTSSIVNVISLQISHKARYTYFRWFMDCLLCFEIGLRYLSHCNIVGFLLLYYTLLLTPFTQHSWELGYLTTSNSSIFPLSTLIL